MNGGRQVAEGAAAQHCTALNSSCGRCFLPGWRWGRRTRAGTATVKDGAGKLGGAQSSGLHYHNSAREQQPLTESAHLGRGGLGLGGAGEGGGHGEGTGLGEGGGGRGEGGGLVAAAGEGGGLVAAAGEGGGESSGGRASVAKVVGVEGELLVGVPPVLVATTCQKEGLAEQPFQQAPHTWYPAAANNNLSCMASPKQWAVGLPLQTHPPPRNKGSHPPAPLGCMWWGLVLPWRTALSCTRCCAGCST